MARVPAGGPANINGVLYQLLWSLLRSVRLHVLNHRLDHAGQEIVEATLRLEPSDGGDLQETSESGRFVDQLKARPDKRPWSLKEVVEEVLPNLYLAVSLGQPETSYRLVTEGRIGGWGEVYEFFHSLLHRDYDPSVLNDSLEVHFQKHRGRAGDPSFWSHTPYTERTLFEKIVAVLREHSRIKNRESVDETRRKLWHLLGRFEVLAGCEQKALQSECDHMLLALVGSDAELAEKRDAMLLDLARLATQGDAVVETSVFLEGHDLNVVPWTDWNALRGRARRQLERSLKRCRYSPEQDVRREQAQEMARSWPIEKPILLVVGESGQGKSWFMYAAAQMWASGDELVVLVEATGDFDRDLMHAAQIIGSIRDIDTVLPPDRVAARLSKLAVTRSEYWLTLVLDGVQDMDEARQIAVRPWRDWGVRVAVSCPPHVADWLDRCAGEEGTRVSVSDFTTGELQDYLQKNLGDRWPRIPGDIRTTLHRPLLAAIYIEEFVRGRDWQSEDEYQLYHAVWRRLLEGPQSQFPGDAVGLRKLATSILDGVQYPWLPDQVFQAGLDNGAVSRLVKVGWLRQAGRDRYEVPHDRLLNWAVAEGLVSMAHTGETDRSALLDRLRQLSESDRTYAGRSLGYVAMDVVWLLATRDDTPVALLENILDALEPTDLYDSDQFYGQLLTTVGPGITPTLISRLRSLARTGSPLLGQIIKGITAVDNADLPEQATQLLQEESPAIQRSAMRILARRPTAAVLDRLWQLHCESVANPEPYLYPHEGAWAVYSDSFGALSACTKRDPDWVRGTITTADADQPVHDLAYLLANLEGEKDLWLRCKAMLFEKVDPAKVRCLARNIWQFRDEEEIPWLVTQVPREDDVIGATCMLALACMAPDIAIENLGRLPARSLYLTRTWWVEELLLRRPGETTTALLEIIKNALDPWQCAAVYQGNEEAMDIATLDFLLDQLATRLRNMLDNPPPENKHPLWCPLSMLASVHRLDLIKCFEKRRDTELEALLMEWVLLRGPRANIGADHEGQNALTILFRIGGKGFTEAIGMYLGSTSQYGRLDGLCAAKKSSDRKILPLLKQVVSQDQLWDGKFPLEQNTAAEALALQGHWSHVARLVVSWGAQTRQNLATAILDARDTGRLPPLPADILEVPSSADQMTPGHVMALGLWGTSHATEPIERLLEEVPRESDLALACVLALGDLRCSGNKAISLLASQLNHHRFAAANSLLRIGSDKALRALLASVKDSFELGYALPLASHGLTRDAAITLVADHLQSCSDFRLHFQLPLLVSEVDKEALVDICTDAHFRERLRELAFADEGTFWVGGSKGAAIRCLKTFDPDSAFLAAKTALGNPSGHDRLHYPRLLMEIAPSQATEVLVSQAEVEEATAVVSALGRALGQLDRDGLLRGYLSSEDSSKRLAACRLLPWQSLSDEMIHQLTPLLDDPSPTVCGAARRAMMRIQCRRETGRLTAAYLAEPSYDRRWVLLDCLVSSADPGEERGPWPQWAREVAEDMPY